MLLSIKPAFLATLLIATQGSGFPGVPEGPQFESGSTLLQLCEGDEAEVGRCIAYIKGVSDTWNFYTIKQERPLCAMGATADQLAQAVVSYIKTHSEAVGPGAEVVMKAVKEAWSCE